MEEKKTFSMENEGDSFLKLCVKVVTWTLNKDFDHDFVVFHHVTIMNPALALCSSWQSIQLGLSLMKQTAGLVGKSQQ